MSYGKSGTIDSSVQSLESPAQAGNALLGHLVNHPDAIVVSQKLLSNLYESFIVLKVNKVVVLVRSLEELRVSLSDCFDLQCTAPDFSALAKRLILYIDSMSFITISSG